MYKYIILLFALCSNLYAIKPDTVYTQKPLYERAQDTLSVRQMKEDIEFYFKTLKAKHANLYAYASPKQFKALEKQMYKKCNHPMTTIEFNYQMMLLNKFTDSHTGIAYLFHEEIRPHFPYASFTDSSMWLGDRQILSINKIPTPKLIATLDSMVSWEHHRSNRFLFHNKYLRLILATAYQIVPPYTISMRQKGSNIVTDSTLQSISPIAWQQQIPTRNRSEYHYAPVDSVFFLKDSIALLCYNTSSPRAFARFDLDNYLTSFFKLAKEQGIKYLFIDLSQNEGGSDGIHNYITKHLRSKEDSYTMHFQATQDGLKEYLKIGGTKIDTKEKVYIEANNEGFDGKVYVIMGNNTYSAGFTFCERIKRRQIGLLVGEEAGQRFPFSGNTLNATLPHSLIPFRYPVTYGWHEKELPSNNGFLQPDIPYDLSKPLEIDDFRNIIKMSKSLPEQENFKTNSFQN